MTTEPCDFYFPHQQEVADAFTLTADVSPGSSGARTVSPGSPSLVPGETAEHADDASASVRWHRNPTQLPCPHRHVKWKTRRQSVYAALAAAGVPYARLDSFEHCGDGGWLLESTTKRGTYRFVEAFCHDRWCEPCQKDRARTIRDNMAACIKGGRYRFVTFTLAVMEADAGQQIDRLWSSFKKLRRLPLWKERTNGGAAFVELKFNAIAHHWHIHLHVLQDGRFIPQAYLAAAWLDVTGDSRIVDIRQITTAREAANYVSKYVTKAVDEALLTDPDRLRELITTCRGRRLCLTFGSWRRVKLLTKHTEPGWKTVAHTATLLIARTIPAFLLKAICRARDAWQRGELSGEFVPDVLPEDRDYDDGG